VRTVNIGCVGDSLTEGGYPRVLQELLNARESSCQWHLHNLGILGSSTKEWANIHIPAKAHHPPGISAGGIDLYLVMLGTNDAQVSTKFNEQMFCEQLSRIGRHLGDEGATVLLITPPPVEPGGSFTQFIDVTVMNSVIPRIMPQVAATLGCGCADAFSALGGSKPKHEALIDGVHLTPEGNKLIAHAILNQVHQVVMQKAGGNMPARQPTVCENKAAASNALPGLVLPAPVPVTLPTAKTQPAAVAVSSSPFSALSPTAKMSATPRLNQSQAEGYHVGAAVEIFSNTWDKWFSGRCTQLEGTTVLTEFVTPDGMTKEKRMPVSHPDVRLFGKASLQATPVCTSPVNGTARSTALCSSPLSKVNNAVISSIMSSATRTTVKGAAVSPLNSAAIGPVVSPVNGTKRNPVHTTTLSPLNAAKSRHSHPIIGQSAFLPPAVNSVYKRHRGYSDTTLLAMR